jgi:hypothetical protein
MNLIALLARHSDGDGRIHAAGNEHDGLANDFPDMGKFHD